jgi:hypothetical protein
MPLLSCCYPGKRELHSLMKAIPSPRSMMSRTASLALSLALVLALVPLLAASRSFALPPAPAPAPAQNAANPAPPPGVTIEPERQNQPPTTKFTNATDRELVFIYGPEKFRLKSGASTSVPLPRQPAMFDLRIAEWLKEGQYLDRYHGKATPNDAKRFIPFPWKRLKVAK